MNKFRKLLFFSVPFIFIVFFLLWYREGYLPVDRSNTQTKVFVINPGESVTQISRNLDNEQLIRSRIVFYLIVKRLGIEKSIQAGNFRLSPSMSAPEVALQLTHGILDTWVTIIEGLRKEEVVATLAQKLGLSSSVLMRESQEGYLFPDTYLVPKGATETQVLSMLRDTFNDKVTTEIRNAAAKRNLTLNGLVTMASLVEREAQSYEDKQMIAGILFNRLEIGMPLQVDASVQYALGFDEKSQSWWKKDLTFDDLKYDSSYNTYVNTGLPPGPIANPGLDSLQAVAFPTKSSYLFYITGKDGRMRYSTTYIEHQDNIEKHIE